MSEALGLAEEPNKQQGAIGSLFFQTMRHIQIW